MPVELTITKATSFQLIKKCPYHKLINILQIKGDGDLHSGIVCLFGKFSNNLKKLCCPYSIILEYCASQTCDLYSKTLLDRESNSISDCVLIKKSINLRGCISQNIKRRLQNNQIIHEFQLRSRFM